MVNQYAQQIEAYKPYRIEHSIYRQSGVQFSRIGELIANSIDAQGGSIGRFGLGFKQVLQEDKVTVVTKSAEHEHARVVRFEKRQDGILYLAETMLSPSEFAALFTGTSLPRSMTQVIVECDLYQEDQTQIIDYIHSKYHRCVQATALSINGEPLNTRAGLVGIDGLPILLSPNPVQVSVDIDSSGYVVGDPVGMSDQIVFRHLLNDRVSTKQPRHGNAALYYVPRAADQDPCEVKLVLSGVLIETMRFSDLALPREVIVCFPENTAISSSRSQINFEVPALSGIELLINQLFLSPMQSAEKICLINSFVRMLDEVESAGRLGSEQANATIQRIKQVIRLQIESIFEPGKLYMPRVEGIEWLDTGSAIPTYLEQSIFPECLLGELPICQKVSNYHAGTKVFECFTARFKQEIPGHERIIFFTVGSQVFIDERIYAEHNRTRTGIAGLNQCLHTWIGSANDLDIPEDYGYFTYGSMAPDLEVLASEADFTIATLEEYFQGMYPLFLEGTAGSIPTPGQSSSIFEPIDSKTNIVGESSIPKPTVVSGCSDVDILEKIQADDPRQVEELIEMGGDDLEAEWERSQRERTEKFLNRIKEHLKAQIGVALSSADENVAFLELFITYMESPRKYREASTDIQDIEDRIFEWFKTFLIPQLPNEEQLFIAIQNAFLFSQACSPGTYPSFVTKQPIFCLDGLPYLPVSFINLEQIKQYTNFIYSRYWDELTNVSLSQILLIYGDFGLGERFTHPLWLSALCVFNQRCEHLNVVLSLLKQDLKQFEYHPNSSNIDLDVLQFFVGFWLFAVDAGIFTSVEPALFQSQILTIYTLYERLYSDPILRNPLINELDIMTQSSSYHHYVWNRSSWFILRNIPAGSIAMVSEDEIVHMSDWVSSFEGLVNKKNNNMNYCRALLSTADQFGLSEAVFKWEFTQSALHLLGIKKFRRLLEMQVFEALFIANNNQPLSLESLSHYWRLYEGVDLDSIQPQLLNATLRNTLLLHKQGIVFSSVYHDAVLRNEGYVLDEQEAAFVKRFIDSVGPNSKFHLDGYLQHILHYGNYGLPKTLFCNPVMHRFFYAVGFSLDRLFASKYIDKQWLEQLNEFAERPMKWWFNDYSRYLAKSLPRLTSKEIFDAFTHSYNLLLKCGASGYHAEGVIKLAMEFSLKVEDIAPKEIFDAFTHSYNLLLKCGTRGYDAESALKLTMEFSLKFGDKAPKKIFDFIAYNYGVLLESGFNSYQFEKALMFCTEFGIKLKERQSNFCSENKLRKSGLEAMSGLFSQITLLESERSRLLAHLLCSGESASRCVRDQGVWGVILIGDTLVDCYQRGLLSKSPVNFSEEDVKGFWVVLARIATNVSVDDFIGLYNRVYNLFFSVKLSSLQRQEIASHYRPVFPNQTKFTFKANESPRRLVSFLGTDTCRVPDAISNIADYFLMFGDAVLPDWEKLRVVRIGIATLGARFGWYTAHGCMQGRSSILDRVCNERFNQKSETWFQRFWQFFKLIQPYVDKAWLSSPLYQRYLERWILILELDNDSSDMSGILLRYLNDPSAAYKFVHHSLDVDDERFNLYVRFFHEETFSPIQACPAKADWFKGSVSEESLREIDIAELMTYRAGRDNLCEPLQAIQQGITDLRSRIPVVLIQEHRACIESTLAGQSGRKALWIREFIQNAIDASTKPGERAEVIIEIEQYFYPAIEGDFDFVFSVRDSGKGMDLQEILNYLLIPGSSDPEKREQGLIGEFGIGFFTWANEPGVRVEIKTSKGNDSVYHIVLSTQPRSKDGGNSIRIDSIDKTPNLDCYKGTEVRRIQRRSADEFIAAQREGFFCTYEIDVLTTGLSAPLDKLGQNKCVSIAPENPVTILYNGTRFKAAKRQLLAKIPVNGLGFLGMYREEHSIMSNRVEHANGLFVGPLNHSWTEQVPMVFQEELGSCGIVVMLPAGVRLNSDRMGLCLEHAQLIKTAFFILYIQALRERSFQEDRHPITLPQDYFDSHSALKYESVSMGVSDMRHQINSRLDEASQGLYGDWSNFPHANINLYLDNRFLAIQLATMVAERNCPSLSAVALRQSEPPLDACAAFKSRTSSIVTKSNNLSTAKVIDESEWTPAQKAMAKIITALYEETGMGPSWVIYVDSSDPSDIAWVSKSTGKVTPNGEDVVYPIHINVNTELFQQRMHWLSKRQADCLIYHANENGTYAGDDLIRTVAHESAHIEEFKQGLEEAFRLIRLYRDAHPGAVSLQLENELKRALRRYFISLKEHHAIFAELEALASKRERVGNDCLPRDLLNQIATWARNQQHSGAGCTWTHNADRKLPGSFINMMERVIHCWMLRGIFVRFQERVDQVCQEFIPESPLYSGMSFFDHQFQQKAKLKSEDTADTEYITQP